MSAASSLSDNMVRAEGVHKRFGRLEVLKGIDLTVGRGEVTCLLGPSGSGKSTFLRCINHLEKINSGRLSVDGELVGYREAGDTLYELRESEVARKRSEIGMVFQHFNLFPHMTALENVTLAPMRVLKTPRDQARVRSRELLHHLQHLAHELGVERGGRLVEQHEIGLHRQRPRDRDTLLLPP